MAGTHAKPDELEAALKGVVRLHVTVTAVLAEAGPELVEQAVTGVSEADAGYVLGWYAEPAPRRQRSPAVGSAGRWIHAARSAGAHSATRLA
ncbi:hypothetical protein GCM10010468_46310 [Actinocorallia longicatena]|uniref:Uncharacterized protein n=1 Tax=Actinocorallia longicatena TaxID=111803 RepID=A0ABP6QD58_9ACTN